ncbi:MAG: T9SS C-terminal target domain-containing protein [Ignavibacteriales bacterium]|nr:MAG: T9SS C-terminal target domain-containing protein [Ignavibacteriales bacterium]
MQFEFALEQNYPNPFNPVTTINFTLPNVGTTHELSQQAKLTVYNLLGQEVRTLVNEAKPAGSYQIQFDASDLPSGIYFYSLTYGNHIQTRKLALLK